MQAEDKHKPLDQSSQPSTDPEASKQYSDSFPLISFKSQQQDVKKVPLEVTNDAREQIRMSEPLDLAFSNQSSPAAQDNRHGMLTP
jgi:hypothetical protein